MKTCIKNCILISMDEEREKIEYNTDVLIQNNKIVKIGKDIETRGVDKVIDATNKVVMPGLINSHAHIPTSIFRETLDGDSLQDWLSKRIWPMEDKLTDKDVCYASYLSFIEMIRTGTTTINDMYFITESIIKTAINEVGIRLQTSRTVMNSDGEERGEHRIKDWENIFNKYNGKNERITFNSAIHGLYTTTPEYLDRCIELAKEKKLPVHLHFCENSNEVEDIKRIYGKMPVEIIKEKFKDFKIILAHAVKVSDKDIEALKEMKVSIVHCPISNLRLGCGIAKVNYMLENGINVSLGTDGQGSGSNLDLFEAMKFTALLQKGIEENSEKMPEYEVLKMATINGAKTLGMENEIGSIKEGKLADIIIIDINNVMIKPVNNLISEIVYNVKGSNVITTIVNGNILMENRKLINLKENEIFNECEKVIKRIKI